MLLKVILGYPLIIDIKLGWKIVYTSFTVNCLSNDFVGVNSEETFNTLI